MKNIIIFTKGPVQLTRQIRLQQLPVRCKTWFHFSSKSTWLLHICLFICYLLRPEGPLSLNVPFKIFLFFRNKGSGGEASKGGDGDGSSKMLSSINVNYIFHKKCRKTSDIQGSVMTIKVLDQIDQRVLIQSQSKRTYLAEFLPTFTFFRYLEKK